MTKKKQIILIGIAVLVAIAVITAVLFIVLKKSEHEDEPKKEITLMLSVYEFELSEDEVFVIKATTNSDETVKWSTENNAVASVSSQGRVIAKSVGETVVRASIGEIKQECKIKVVEGIGHNIKLSSDAVRLSVATGGTKISGTVTTGDVTTEIDQNNVAFAIEDQSIATIAADGTVTPVSVGSTLAFVTAGNRTKAVTVDVYTMLVYTVDDYVAMLTSTGNKAARFYIANDIDFSGVLYKAKSGIESTVPNEQTFMGEVDGGGHTISNITMDPSNAYQSLFGMVTAFKLHDISYKNVQFSVGAQACGVAVNILQHITEQVDGKSVDNVYPSLISNVSLDFVYQAHGACGIAYNNYGCAIENTFINMRMADGSGMNAATDYAIAKVFMIWFGTNYFNNVVVLTENGGASLNWELKYNSRDVSKDLIYICNSKMEAGYKVRTKFDENVWTVVPNELPRLK